MTRSLFAGSLILAGAFYFIIFYGLTTHIGLRDFHALHYLIWFGPPLSLLLAAYALIQTSFDETSDFERFDFSRLWISRIIESNIPFRIRHHYVSSIVKLGTIPNLILAYLYITRHEYITNEFLFAYILLAVYWNSIGYLVWHYDERHLPQFFSGLSKIIPDPSKVNALAKKYDELLCRRYWIVAIPWMALILYIWATSSSTLGKAGLLGVGDPLCCFSFVLVLWLAFASSMGFWAILVAILAVMETSKDITLDVLNPDMRGGLSVIGYYVAGTAIAFSVSGSLFLPFAFQLISGPTVASARARCVCAIDGESILI